MIARALLALCLALPAVAHAQDADVLTGTLLAIQNRGVIRIGVRDSSIPFAFRNRGGQPIGFSVDICHGIAEDVAQTLNSDLLEPDSPAWQTGIRIAYVPVAADERMHMVESRAIDLECGSTTATDDRAKTVAFSPVFFMAGTKLAVPPGTATNWRNLAGKPIAVSAGTTNETVLKRLAPSATPPLQIMTVPSVDAAFDAVLSGKAAAVASDDILLAGAIATRPGAKSLRIIGDYLSFEPYAIMLPKNDLPFLTLVNASFARQAEAGVLRTAYQRWFTEPLPTGGNLDLSMSPQLAEIFRTLGQPD